jgi:hypothetical protein
MKKLNNLYNFNEFLLENKSDENENEKIRKEIDNKEKLEVEDIIEFYNTMLEEKLNVDDVEKEFINDVDVFWIPNYVFEFFGKYGFSENRAEQNAIVITKDYKNRRKDEGCMLQHELGHIDTYKNYKDEWKSKEPIIKKSNIEDYPNIMDEYRSFLNQLKALIERYGKNKEKVVDMFLFDYNRGGKPKEVQEEYRIFFKKLYDKLIKEL